MIILQQNQNSSSQNILKASSADGPRASGSKKADHGGIDIGIMFKCGEYYIDKMQRNSIRFEMRDHITFYEKLAFMLYNYIDSKFGYLILKK